MKKTGFFLIVVVGILLSISFSSCSAKDKSDETIKQLEESLINSNKVISISTDATMKALNEKTTESETRERAIVWYPKAEQIVKLSKEVYKYIETAKMQLKEKKISTEMIVEKLTSFKENILTTDSSIREQFGYSFGFVKPVSEVTTSILSILQNNVKIIENKVTAFCNAKVGSTITWFYSYSAIIGQNSKYLKPGDELEITAGVGLYSKPVMRVININGENTEVGEDGYALYKIKVSDKPGQYKIPVKIDFLNPTTGKKEIMEKNIEYTIAKPCDQ